MTHWLYFIVTLVFSLGGQLLLKLGVRQALADAKPSGFEFLTQHLVVVLTTWRVLGGIVLCGIGFVSWLYVLSIYDIGKAFPILAGLGFIAMFLAGWLVLREQVNLWNVIGLAATVAGVYLLSLKPT